MTLKKNILKLFGFEKPTIIQMVSRRFEIFYDKLYGLDFLSVIPLEVLGLDSSVVVQGSPSGNKFLFKVLNDVFIDSDDSILDIGCAKGSALKYFAKFPFNKVHGLELSKTLVQICRKNFNILKKNNVKVFHENATNFKHYNEYNFFYLYNPYPKEVMKKFVVCLKKQILNKEIIIIYNNPVCHNVLITNGFVLIKKYPDMWGNGIFVYSNKKNSSRLKK